jgi:hypothetical protein
MPNKSPFLILSFTLFTLFNSNALEACNPLKPYLWKNVVVLYQLHEEPIQEELAFQQTIDKNYQRFKQDNLIFIDLTGKNTGKLHAQLPAKALKILRRRFKIEANHTEYVIIGMDGWEKFRQAGLFNPGRFINITMKYSSSNSEK